MMTRRLTALLSGAAFVLSLGACAQTANEPLAAGTTPMATPSEPAARDVIAGDAPALWKVSDDDTTIYMFGTIHILPKEVTDWYTPALASALQSSNVMVTEVLISEMNDTAMQQKMMAVGMLPEGEDLRSLLNDEQRTTYEAALQQLGLPPGAFDRMKPWLAAMTLSILPLVQQGYDPTAGVEKVLEERAGADLPREALETVDYQISVFDGMPREAQIDFLVETAAEAQNMKALIDEMVAEWRVGDADGLADLMNDSMEADPLLAERLLYARNRNWAEWIDARLDQPGTIFMAVGAGHLAGDKSVQDYLEERGIDSVRVQ